ncbi:LINE-1 retrotransposable element ORF2 protein [Linum perenne]
MTQIDSKQRELNALWHAEEEYWANRASVNWAKLGDRNTRFFHLSTIQRRRRNDITRLKRDDGVWIDEPREVKNHVKNFFHKLFKAPKEVIDYAIMEDFPRVVADDTNSRLCRPVEEWEIKKAVFQMGPHKSPGPDGYGGSFFQRHWDLIKGDMVRDVQGFFQSAAFPQDWNLTHIALIPKVTNPERISQYRPISVANFKAKVISKVLSTRLKPILPGLISELQAAFTGNRCIQDSIIILHEVIHKLKNRRKGRNYDFVLKVDMMKAYDRVSWDFLFIILEKMGFSSRWVGWIKAIVSSVKFAVMINGRPTEFFSPTRGLRQGDPISPFLFIMITNALSHLIHAEVIRGGIRGIRLNPSCPPLTHVLFADDTVIFGRATTEEVRNFKDIIARYSAISGQLVNEEKSAMFFSKNTPDEVVRNISGMLGVAMDIKLGKYLGLPAEWGRSKADTFHFLIDRMMSRAGHWNSLLLSQGGKEVLSKAVLQAIPSHVFSCFMLPDSLLNKMDGLIARFWWSGDIKRKSIHWCSKERLTTTKQLGGLGFRSFKEFNLAHLAKLGWRIIHNPNALWVRVLKALYFPRCDFVKAKGHHRPSWIWGSILKGREALFKGLRRNVGNGRDTTFEDAWFPGTEDFRCQPDEHQSWNIAECIDQERRQWDLVKLRSLFAENIVQEIRSIPIGPPNLRDKWIWHFDSKGLFSIKSCYNLLKNGRRDLRAADGSTNREWKWIWQLSIPPKVKFFAWRIVSNLLPTKENMMRRKCAADPLCPCCLQTDENLYHLFFDCAVTKEIWRELMPTITPPGQQLPIKEWLERLGEDAPDCGDIRAKAVLCCWIVWKARNEMTFQGVKPTSQEMRTKLLMELNRYHIGREDPQRRGESRPVNEEATTNLQQADQMPRSHEWRFLCDGSYKEDVQKAGIGVISVNPEGRVVDGVAHRILCRRPIVAEAYAVLTACRLAARERVRSEIWSDCQQVVRACCATDDDGPWECSAIVAEVKNIINSSPWISLVNCRRDQVAIADGIARRVREERLDPHWLSQLQEIAV